MVALRAEDRRKLEEEEAEEEEEKLEMLEMLESCGVRHRGEALLSSSWPVAPDAALADARRSIFVRQKVKRCIY